MVLIKRGVIAVALYSSVMKGLLQKKKTTDGAMMKLTSIS